MNLFQNMFFKPKFYYESAAGEGDGGGNSDVIIDDKKDQQVASDTPADPPKVEVPQQIISDEEMKSFGFNSKEELTNFLVKQKDQNISPEEKQQKENVEKANFLKFSAENKLLNVEDYTQYETLKAKADKDLVYEKHLADFKIDHPELKDEDEIEAAAKEDFEYEYKLKEGETEAAKKKGEAKLAKEAKELRSPIETKVTSAQEQFKQNNNIRETYPKFEKFVDESILKNTPDKVALVKVKDGDKEIEIEIELTKADRDAMAKDFKTPKTFGLYTSGKPEEIQAKLDAKMQGWIIKNKSNEVNQKSFELGKGIGLKNGSNVGAENPFALQGGSGGTKNTGEETLEESNIRMAKARQQYLQGR